jgi:hypothetical protein
MMLHEILIQVLKLVDDINYNGAKYDLVTISRADEHAYQVRFAPDKSVKRGYRVEGRRWMDGTERTPTSGTERAYVGWARWSGFMGFGVDAVIATDWKIL